MRFFRVSSLVVSVVCWLVVSAPHFAQAAPGDLDETGAFRGGGVPDAVFFQALAHATGGSLTFIADNPPLQSGPPVIGVTGACCLPDGTCCEGTPTNAVMAVLCDPMIAAQAFNQRE